MRSLLSQSADQVKDAHKLGGVWRVTPYYDPTAFADVTEARFGNTGYNILADRASSTGTSA